jgi:hypothetical protein
MFATVMEQVVVVLLKQLNGIKRGFETSMVRGTRRNVLIALVVAGLRTRRLGRPGNPGRTIVSGDVVLLVKNFTLSKHTEIGSKRLVRGEIRVTVPVPLEIST